MNSVLPFDCINFLNIVKKIWIYSIISSVVFVSMVRNDWRVTYLVSFDSSLLQIHFCYNTLEHACIVPLLWLCPDPCVCQRVVFNWWEFNLNIKRLTKPLNGEDEGVDESFKIKRTGKNWIYSSRKFLESKRKAYKICTSPSSSLSKYPSLRKYCL